MSCIKNTPTNQNPSNLYKDILDKIAKDNVSMADKLYSHFASDAFMSEFGNYILEYKNRITSDRVDENGEPRLFTNDVGDFYYIDKKGERKLFPVEKRSIIQKVRSEELQKATNSLAINFLADTIGVSFEDIDLSNTSTMSIKDYILSEIDKRLAEVENMRTPAEIKSKNRLPIFKEHIDEVVGFVRDQFIRVDLNFTEAEDLDLDLDLVGESVRDLPFGSSSFERNAKDNVRTNTKLRMSLIPDTSTGVDLFGKPSYLEYDTVWAILLDKLSDNYQTLIPDFNQMSDVKSEMINRIKDIVKTRPEFQILVDVLENPSTSEGLLTEIYQAFNVMSNTFLATENVNKGHSNTITSKNTTESTSVSSDLRKDWNFNFINTHVIERSNQSEEFVDEQTNKPVTVRSQVSEHLKGFIDRLESIEKYLSDSNDKNLSNVDENGISTFEIVDEQFKALFKEMFGYDLADNILLEATRNERLPRNNAMRVIVKGLILDLKTFSGAKGSLSRVLNSRNTNINYLENSTALRQLGNSEALFKNSNNTASILSTSGNAYTKSNKNHIDTQINTWRENPQELRKLFEGSAYTNRSLDLAYLLAEDVFDEQDKLEISNKRLREFASAIFLDYYDVNKEGVNGMASKEMTIEDYTVDYIQKVATNGFVRTPAPADKSTDIQLKIGRKINNPFVAYRPAENTAITLSPKVIEVFRNYFLSEAERMIEAEKQFTYGNKDNLKIHYHFQARPYLKDGSLVRGNAFASQYFPILSPKSDTKNIPPYKRVLVEKIKDILYSEGKIKDTFIDLNNVDSITKINDPTLNALLDEFIAMELSDNIIKTHNRMKSDGIISYHTATLEDSRTVKSKIDSKTFANYYSSYTDYAGFGLATDFYINATIKQIEFSKLFTGDIAYYKDSVDYKKRVPETYTDGIVPIWDRTSYNYAVINPVEVEDYLNFDHLVNTFGADVANMYKGTNSADAQAWITPERWKEINKGIYWTPAHDSVYEKMMSGKDEQYTREELKIVAQPLKGVYYWRDSDGAPLYFKYSQAVLTPRLVKGTPLEAVVERMRGIDANGNKSLPLIDELITLDGVKVGAPKMTKLHNSDGTMISSDKLSFNVQQADIRGWKLQQDLPIKTFKDTELGSQIQKNIFFAVKYNPGLEFELDGEILTGQDIIDGIVDQVKGFSNAGLKKLFNRFGFNAEGVIDNPDAMYEALIDELRSRNGSLSIIQALENRMTLYGIPQVRHKIDTMFASIVNKNIVKMKTNGGSFIQMSNFGMSMLDAENSGVLLHPDFKKLSLGTMNTFEPRVEEYDYTTTKSDGTTETVKRKKVIPAGIFISGSFIAKYIPNYRQYSSEQLFGYTNKEGVFVEGIIDRRILEDVIGYRIPNQGAASNDALQIVGILPEENGDTIVAYTGITTKTGSDFDIDKMYVMMPYYNAVVTKEVPNIITGEIDNLIEEGNVNKSIVNISSYYKDLIDAGLDYDFKPLVEAMVEVKNGNEELASEVEKLSRNLANQILSSELIDSPAVTSFMKKHDITPTSLVYSYTPGTNAYYANNLIKYYKAILTHPDLMSTIGRPIDYTFLKQGIVKMTESLKDDQNASLYHFSPLEDVDLLFDFRNGKAGIGQEANAMVDLGRLSNLSINVSDKFLWGRQNDSVIDLDNKKSLNISEQDLSDYIEFLGLTKQGDIDLLKSEIIDVDVMSSLSVVQKAFLDIAKDPYITQGNWLTSTNNIGNTLLRMGVHPTYVMAYMAQPALKASSLVFKKENKNIKTQEYVWLNILKEVYRENEDVIEVLNLILKKDSRFLMNVPLKEKIKDTVDILRENRSDMSYVISAKQYVLNPHLVEAYDTVVNGLNLMKEAASSNDNITDTTLFPLRKWLDNIGNMDIVFQAKVAELTTKIRDYANVVKMNIDVSRIDTDGIGKSVSRMVLINNKVNQLISGGVLNNFDDKISTNTPLGVFYNNLNNFTQALVNNSLLFKEMDEKSISVANEISYIASRIHIVNEELFDKVKNHMYSQMMTDFFNISREEASYLLTQFPLDFAEFKRENLSSYRILEDLNVRVLSKKSVVRELIFKSNRPKSNLQEQVLIDSWAEMLEGGYFGLTVPPISVKWCHFEKFYNNTKKVIPNSKSLSFSSIPH